jgi:hypothetical protein
MDLFCKIALYIIHAEGQDELSDCNCMQGQIMLSHLPRGGCNQFRI